MFEISIEILSYQRKFTSKLMKIWHTFWLLTFNLHVNICFLNQIFSLCYLFFRHASYIIFNFHRDERCKFHIRYRIDQRVKKNKIVNNLWRFHFQHIFNFVTIAHFQHKFLINNDDDEIIFTFLEQRFLVQNIAKLIDIFQIFCFE